MRQVMREARESVRNGSAGIIALGYALAVLFVTSRCRWSPGAFALLAFAACGGRTVGVAGSGNSSGVGGGAETGGSGTSSGVEDGRLSMTSGANDEAALSPKCGPKPVQLVDLNSLAAEVHAEGIGAMQIAIDGANVYFVFGAALMRVPLRGGPASSMLALPGNIIQNNDPVVTSNRVLLHGAPSAGNDEQIVSVPTQGGSATTLATSNGRVDAFTASDAEVYFVDSSGLQSVPVTGGSVKVLSNQLGSSASGVALIGSNLVVTTNGPETYGPDASTPGSVLSVPMQGGPPTILAPNQPSASLPMACGMDICWYTGAPPSPNGTSGPDFIARLAGGDVTSIAAENYPWSLVFDGSSFFEAVGCDICSGTLVRIPSTGGSPVKMVSASYAAVDDECVYFSVVNGFDLPSADDGGIPGGGIYSVVKSYSDPLLW
jgi:hypothetical protein